MRVDGYERRWKCHTNCQLLSLWYYGGNVSPQVSSIWILGPKSLGRLRRCDPAGESMSLGQGFEISRAMCCFQCVLSVPCLLFKMWAFNSSFQLQSPCLTNSCLQNHKPKINHSCYNFSFGHSVLSQHTKVMETEYILFIEKITFLIKIRAPNY